MKYQLVVFASTLLMCVGANAQTARKNDAIPNGVLIYGAGTASCGVWLDTRAARKKPSDDARQIQLESFLDGFASGVSWAEPTEKNRFGSTDIYAKRSYLDKFCRENPTKPFGEAAMSLIVHLSGRGE